MVCPGSISRLLPIPGLAEQGIGFKTIGEAIYLRNHVLSRLDLAASTNDPERRRRALTFVFVGGGYAGVEAMAELEDMARYAMRYLPAIDADRHALGAGRGGRAGSCPRCRCGCRPTPSTGWSSATSTCG